MAVPPPAPTLPCKDCGFVNEPERVYCHNCGAKLDRSILPREEQLRREAPDRARRRIMRMANPGANFWKTWVLWALKPPLYGMLIAAVIVAFKPPTDAPPEKGGMSSRLVSSDLSDTMMSRTPRTVSFTQPEINSFLASGRLKDNGAVPGVMFKRAYVNLEPGVCRFSVEKTIVGLPLYFGTIYRVEANAGVFVAVNVGGNVGRLPIHPSIMNWLGPLMFKNLQEALKAEYDLVRQAYTLRIDKGRVGIVSRGGAH